MPYKRKEKNSLLLYYDYIEQFEELNDKQLRQLIYAMIEYDKNDNEIELDDITRMAFIPIKRRLKQDKENYTNKCEVSSENAKKRWKQEYAMAYDSIQEHAKYGDKDKDKEKDKDIDIDKDIINNNNNINNIYTYIEENFGRCLSPIEYEEISNWQDNELTRYAIKQAVLGGIYNIKYIARTLDNYKKNSIITIQQAQEDTERYKQSKKYKSSTDRTNEVFERFLAKGES